MDFDCFGSYPPRGGREFDPPLRNEESAVRRILLMFSVYVLYSALYDKIYVGFTSDLEQRILSHNELATKGWTIKFRPWKLVHTEFFERKTEAMRREKQLKTASGRRWIWQLIHRL